MGFFHSNTWYFPLRWRDKVFRLYVLQVLLGEELAFINEQPKGSSLQQFSSRVATVLSYDDYQAKGVSCFERNGPYMSDQLGPLGYLLYFLRVKTKLCDMQIIVSHEFRISFLSKSGLHVSCLHKLVFCCPRFNFDPSFGSHPARMFKTLILQSQQELDVTFHVRQSGGSWDTNEGGRKNGSGWGSGCLKVAPCIWVHIETTRLSIPKLDSCELPQRQTRAIE